MSSKQFIGPHALLQDDVTPRLNLTTLLILTTPAMLNSTTLLNSLTLLNKDMRPDLIIVELKELFVFNGTFITCSGGSHHYNFMIAATNA